MVWRTALTLAIVVFLPATALLGQGKGANEAGEAKVDTPKPALKDVSQETLCAKITLPWNNSMVRATVPVFGFAGGRDFKAYRLEYGEGRDPKTWIPVSSGTKPWNQDPWSAGQVRWSPNSGASGTLGDWHTGLTSYAYSMWKDNLFGDYTLRLVVEGKDGTTAEDRVHVIVADVLTKAMGGSTKSPDDRLRLSVDKDSLTSSFVLVSMQPSTEPKLDTKLVLIGRTYEFQPPGLDFLKPARLTATYKDSDLVAPDGRQIPISKLGIYYYKPVEEVWSRMPSRVVADEKTVIAEMTGSTKYLAYVALMADVTPPDVPKLASFNHDLSGYSTSLAGVAEPGSTVEILLDGKSVTRCPADDDGRFVTQRLKPARGEHELSARAIDAAGNESPLSEAIKLIVAPTPPKTVRSIRWLGNVEARRGDRFLVELVGEDASDRVDHALINVASDTDPKGIEVELTETGPKTGIFVGLVTIADESSAEVPQIKAVRQKEKILATCSVDPVKRAEIEYVDDIPPTTPVIQCPGYPMRVLNTFEEAADSKRMCGWHTVEGKFGAALSLEESKGNSFLKLTRQQWQSHMGAVAFDGTYDTREWPLVAFDCLIPEGMKIDFLVSVKDLGTFTVRLTGDEKPFYPLIGAAYGIRTDGQWSHVLINLHSMLSRHFAGKSGFQVEQLQFASWADRGLYRHEYAGNGAAGVWIGLDNFAVFSFKDVPVVTFTWDAQDQNGIAGYSFLFDRIANTVPPEQALPVTAGTFPLTEPGTHYLHVRAADRCGNWSRTAHYMVMCDREPPGIGKMTVESAPGRQLLRIPVRDSGVGLDLWNTVLCVADRTYDWSSGTLSYDRDKGVLTFDPWAAAVPHLCANGEKMDVSLAVSDVVGLSAENRHLGEYAAASPLRVTPPNPDGASRFYLKGPEIGYEPIANEKTFFDWQVKFAEDPLSQKGHSLNTLMLTVEYPDGKKRSFIKELKLDAAPPRTSVFAGLPGAEKPFTGGPIAKGELIVLKHDAYALRVGGLEGRFFADAEFKAPFPVAQGQDGRPDPAAPGADAKAMSALWEGALRVPTAGDFDLQIGNVDPFGESRLLIDGESVGSKPRDRVKEEVECRVFLTKGWHRLRFEQTCKTPTTAHALSISWMPKGKARLDPVPSDCLAACISLATTSYQWDGGAWQTLSGPITPLPGAHKLSFRSESVSGQKEAPTTIDVNAP